MDQRKDETMTSEQLRIQLMNEIVESKPYEADRSGRAVLDRTHLIEMKMKAEEIVRLDRIADALEEIASKM